MVGLAAMKAVPSSLPSKVGQSIVSQGLLHDGQRILVAVSGGLDSMVLLDVLHRLALTRRWKLVVAHFNHQLRGAASDADEHFVARAAGRPGLHFVTERWREGASDSARRRHGLEMAARLARHDFLARAARENGARVIALAHHAGDQVELFFLRLLRGSGGEGLAGMKWISPSPADQRITLVRPLLDLPKAVLEEYARRLRIAFREDASNRDERHDRNWLRQQLLPALARRFGAGGLTAIRRSMELAGEDADFARQSAEAWLGGRRSPRLDRLHPAVQRQCIRLQLQRLGLPMGFELVEHLREFALEPISATPDAVVRREAGGLVVRRASRVTRFATGSAKLELGSEGKSEFAGVKFRWVREAAGSPFRRPAPSRGRESFDAAKVGPAVRLRHWQPGDRFQPIGMKRPVKLQDLFTNAKIPQAKRHALIVAETGRGEIFWVEGLRIGEQFKLSPQSRFRLGWHWHRKPAQASGLMVEALSPG